jgi:aspartate/methionine/tyrosine aminotransferase
MEKKVFNFAYGTNELPELRSWQDKWKREADDENYYSIADFRGIPELQKAVHTRFADRGVKNGCSARQVMITSGGTEALFSSLLWIKSIGGTVILQHPSWSYFSDTLRLLNISFIYCRAESASKLQLELDSLNPAGTFLFILTHPSNPFSHIFSEGYLSALSEWANAGEGNYVLSDEIYDWYVDERHGFQSWSSIHGLKNSIIVHGYSKATGLAGFRIGYLLADTAVYRDLFPFHYSSSYGASIYSQYIALKAQADEKEIRKLLDGALSHRWQILGEQVEENNHLRLCERNPGMYSYWKIKAPENRQRDFVQGLKKQTGVMVNPGWNFGVKDGGFRFNLCRPAEEVKKGVTLIQEFAKDFFQ